MIAYIARAVPWRLTVAATVIVAGLLAVVGTWPWKVWPLQGTALGVIAGATAWAADECAASVVDTAPRPLWWRTAARAIVAPLLFTVWMLCLFVVRDRLPDRLWLFALQGAGVILLALAVTTGRRAAGSAEPGRAFAAIAIPTAAALALIRPKAQDVPLFPIWPGENWTRSAVIWSVIALGSALALAAILIKSARPASPRSCPLFRKTAG